MEKQEYLDNVLKPILESLVFQLVSEKPENPKEFILDWCVKTGGGPVGLTKSEMEELQKLKEEMKGYKEIEKLEKKNKRK